MGRILVTYDSGYGATAAAAGTIAEALTEKGLQVDLRPVGPKELSGYDAVIVGSPVRMGQCTSRIKQFLRKNLPALKSVPVAFFFTCMSVTGNHADHEISVYIDPSFDVSGKPRARLSMMKSNHTAAYYLEHFLKHVPGITPLGISFFKGRLHMAQLSYFHRLIMRFAMFALPEIQNGDFLNQIIIRAWAESLVARMSFA